MSDTVQPGEPHLLVRREEGVTTLVLNRPERHNAYSPEMMCRLADAWIECRDDPDVRVVIITGAGDTAFTSGGDLGLLIPLFTGARAPADAWDERLKGDMSIMNTVLLKDVDFPKPVICAVNGTALAGGTELMQACDIRLAVPHATFGLPEPKRGIVPGGGSMVRLARQIPYAHAMEILLTGDDFDADQALAMGLINRIVEPDRLMDETASLAKRIAANAPLALQAIKRTIAATTGLPIDQAFEVEARESGRVMRSEDAREGPRAFMEKRAPRFRGR